MAVFIHDAALWSFFELI